MRKKAWDELSETAQNKRKKYDTFNFFWQTRTKERNKDDKPAFWSGDTLGTENVSENLFPIPVHPYI